MNNIVKGLCWAGAMLFVALGASLGYMDRDAAQIMLLAMPVVAINTIRNKRPCRLGSRA